MNAAWEELARHLPRVAEEGPDHEVVSEAALVQHLVQTAGSPIAAETFVASARRLLLATAALDDQEVAKGNWRIVSFPALLFARSLLLGIERDHRGKPFVCRSASASAMPAATATFKDRKPGCIGIATRAATAS